MPGFPVLHHLPELVQLMSVESLMPSKHLVLSDHLFLPKSKRLLISRLQSPFAVILEPKNIKSAIVLIDSPSIFHEMMGSDAMIFIFEY